MIQHPIYLIIVTAITLFLVMIQSVQNERIFKYRLFLSLTSLVISVLAFTLYDQHIKNHTVYNDIYIYFSFAVYAFFFLIIFSVSKTTVLKTNQYQLFVKSIKESRWNVYYLVDKRERIKDISESLLDELGLEKQDVIGKKLFHIFNQTVRFTMLGQNEITNRKLENYYNEYKRNVKAGESEIQELIFLNHVGEKVTLNAMMQPLFVLGQYRGRMVVGEKKSDLELMTVEKNLLEKSKALESIRHKFIATLEISEEGLFYIDLDERIIWASDQLVSFLKLPDNTIDLLDFRRLIHPEDHQKYMTVLNDLSISRQHYTMRFRILVDGRYVWFKERGKRLFEDYESAVIMGTLNPIPVKHFQASQIPILDEMGTLNDMLVHMNQLFLKGKYFQLMIIDLKNIPKINELHGRDLGNVVMGDYIRKMKESFITESGNIYRITGLQFGILLTDPRKIDLLKQGIIHNPRFLNETNQYGSLHIELEVFAGIAVGGSDATDEKTLYECALKALKVAENPQYEGNGFYYKDLAWKKKYEN